MDKAALLNKVSEIKGSLGALIISKDGLVLEKKISDDLDENLVGAVISSMFTNIEVQSKRMDRGALKRFSIETEQKTLTISAYNIGSETVLSFNQFEPDSDLDNIFNSLNSIA